MSRLLLFGLSPLPFENEQRMYGPGIRTWQFARPLLDDGHEVHLVTMRIAGAYAAGREAAPPAPVAGLARTSLGEREFRNRRLLRRIAEDVRPDAVIGATAYGSDAAVRTGTDRPIWADLFGDLMAEGQAKAAVYGTDGHLFHFWDLLRPVYDRADAFSAVTDRQAFALWGALSTRGRVNRFTEGESLVATIPCADEAPPPARRRPVLRGVDCPEGAFVVLWSGGYNTWADVDTLFDGVERAMAIEPRIHFASTGGQIDGHDERTYPRFCEKVARSRYAERFHLRGWIPTQEVPDYWLEADVGLHCERRILERLLGSENRVLGWMRSGLATVLSDVSELSGTVRREELGFVYPAGDAAALARLLVDLARDPARVAGAATRARAWFLAEATFARTTEPLRAWARNPRPAADRGHRVRLELAEGDGSSPSLLRRLRVAVAREGWGGAALRAARWARRRLTGRGVSS